MKATIDLTDDDSWSGDGEMPFPSLFRKEDDVVVLQIREVEVRMTFPQFLQMHEASGAWLVRDLDGELDVNASRYPMKEHEELRKIFREIIGDTLNTTEVPEAVRRAIRIRLEQARIDADKWIGIHDQLLAHTVEVAELQVEIAALKKKLRARSLSRKP